MARLLNVRLSEEESALVDRLKRRGVTLSDVVRTALRSEYARHYERAPAAPADLLQWLHEKYPAPAGIRRRSLDTTDRRQVAAFLRSRLRKGRLKRRAR